MVVYGMFENSLGNLCRVAQLDGKITKSLPKKLHMPDVKGYLRPHIRTQPRPFAKEWEWMDEFRIIRNWMAHNGGKVQRDGDNWVNAKNFRRRNPRLIKFASFDEIIVEEGLVDRALEKATRATATIGRLWSAFTLLRYLKRFFIGQNAKLNFPRGWASGERFSLISCPHGRPRARCQVEERGVCVE